MNISTDATNANKAYSDINVQKSFDYACKTDGPVETFQMTSNGFTYENHELQIAERARSIFTISLLRGLEKEKDNGTSIIEILDIDDEEE